MSVEFDRGSPGMFDSRTLGRETLSRWTGRTLERGYSRIMLSPPQNMKPYLGHEGQHYARVLSFARTVVFSENGKTAQSRIGLRSGYGLKLLFFIVFLLARATHDARCFSIGIYFLGRVRPFFILRMSRPRIFESKFRNQCAKKLDGALRKPTSSV